MKLTFMSGHDVSTKSIPGEFDFEKQYNKNESGRQNCRDRDPVLEMLMVQAERRHKPACSVFGGQHGAIRYVQFLRNFS